MDIKQINEQLTKFIEQQINEMAILYGRSLGYSNNILDAINRIETAKQGHIKTSCNLIVKAPVTTEEIQNGIYDKILKGVIVEKSYPITIVWGEADKKGLQGHGLVHILQGHKADYNSIKNELNKAINDKCKAVLINNKGQLLWKNKWIFSFALFNLDGKPEEAVLITGFKK